MQNSTQKMKKYEKYKNSYMFLIFSIVFFCVCLFVFSYSFLWLVPPDTTLAKKPWNYNLKLLRRSCEPACGLVQITTYYLQLTSPCLLFTAYYFLLMTD